MNALVYLNGSISKPENAVVSVMDRGFLFGDGVYEAGRSYDRCFLYLEEHWERFRRSASKLSLQIPWSDQMLTDGLHAVANEFAKDNVCFRTIATRGPIDTVGLEAESGQVPTLVHVVQPLPSKFAEQRSQGAKLTTSSILRNASQAQDPNIKTSNYLNSLLAHQEVKRRGGFEAIMLNASGEVTEGTNFSVFAVTAEKRLITPCLEIGILDSITRRHVLQIANGKVPFEEGRYSLAQFLEAEEVFIVSSTREILPVSQWDDSKFPVPGPITERLYQSLCQDIQRYTETHPKF